MGPGNIIDLSKLFQGTFGAKPYVIPGMSDNTESTTPGFQVGVSSSSQLVTPSGSLLQEKVKGIDILLPVKFYDQDTLLMSMPYCVCRVSSKKSIVKTSLPERIGTVKEQYSIDDYSITVKGFIIGDNKTFPEKDLQTLKQLYETKTAVTMENALTNIFLTNPELPRYEQRRVVILDLDLPEVSGGRENVRPFSMMIESDTVFILELE